MSFHHKVHEVHKGKSSRLKPLVPLVSFVVKFLIATQREERHIASGGHNVSQNYKIYQQSEAET